MTPPALAFPPARRTPAPSTASDPGGLPPSALTVLGLLDAAGPTTHKELVANAGLPARTVRFALARLLAAGLVEQRPSLRDARQSSYRLRASAEAAPRPLSWGPAADIRGLA